MTTLFFLLAAMIPQDGDIMIADFEWEKYGDWEAAGEAFGPGPARGTLPQQMEVTGFLGKALVNSFFGGDKSTGTLTSPPFKIERRFINFLVGGGMHPEETCMNLLVDGKTARTVTGPNDRPGGSEQLSWRSWDVADLQGKTARLQIVDRHTGGWGHINVDHIVLGNQRAAVDHARELTIEKACLNFPVKNGAPMRRVSLDINGKKARAFEIELAEGEPDFWTILDVRPFRGIKATLRVDALPPGSKALEAVTQDDTLRGADDLYREKHRPQFHFSARRGWLNDPNGLVFHKGEYHLYYQHNPYGWKWGNMHWGHAVSRDLVRWEELPIAIYPPRLGDWAFSGSAVVDSKNTAGWKKGDEEVIVAAWTSTGRGECLSYSLDRGRTFTEYEGNPVVKHNGRDPKIIWYEPGNHWVMAVYDEPEKKRFIAFYTSPDLKKWEYRSRIEGYFECPEIFELAVDGDAKNRKWVLYGADGDYAIGAFDGKTFTPEGARQKFHRGNCFYASQTYSDIPAEDGRRIQVGWGRVELKGMPFNQIMLFPTELSLRTSDEGVRLFARPVREIRSLHSDRKGAWEAVEIPEGARPIEGDWGDLHIRVDLELGTAIEAGLSIRGTPVTVGADKLTCRGKSAPLKIVDGRVRLEILVDRATIEIFAQEGRIYMPIGIVHPADNRGLILFASGGAARAKSLEVINLKSAWAK